MQKEQKIKNIKLNKTKQNEVNLVLENDVAIINKKGEEIKDYSYEIKLNDINLPIKKGEVLGRLELKSDNKIISSTNLLADRNLEKANIFTQYLRVIGHALSGSI